MATYIEQIAKKAAKQKRWRAGKDWVKYSGPVFDEKEYEAAIEQITSGWLIMGENCRKVEAEFPKFLGCDFGIFTNSGSSANLLMMAAFEEFLMRSDVELDEDGIIKRDAIITTPCCFPTTLNPIIQHGFEPVFVDAQIPNMNLDLDEVEKVLDARDDICAIMFAHALGVPPDMDRLIDLCDKHDVYLLEDCCDAVGSEYDSQLLGSFGLMSTCSFFPAHHMTCGEGGFVATNNPLCHKLLASYRDWGRACTCNVVSPGDVTDKTACGSNRFKDWLGVGFKQDHRYIFERVGYNLKPLDVQGAMLLQQMKKEEEFKEKRKVNHKEMMRIFEPFSKYFYFQDAPKRSRPSWFAFLLTVRPDAPFTREEFMEFLESKKIQTRMYFTGNILRHGEIYSIFAEPHEFIVSDMCLKYSMFLGVYPGLTKQQLKYIEKCVKQFFRSIKKRK